MVNTFVPLLIITGVIGLISGFVIWVVGRLGLGLEVKGFGSAFVAGLVIAFLAGIVSVLLGLAGFLDGSGLIGALVHLLISAGVLLVSGRLLPGFKVFGFTGALLASLVIGAVYWLGGVLLGQIL